MRPSTVLAALLVLLPLLMLPGTAEALRLEAASRLAWPAGAEVPRFTGHFQGRADLLPDGALRFSGSLGNASLVLPGGNASLSGQVSGRLQGRQIHGLRLNGRLEQEGRPSSSLPQAVPLVLVLDRLEWGGEGEDDVTLSGLRLEVPGGRLSLNEARNRPRNRDSLAGRTVQASGEVALEDTGTLVALSRLLFPAAADSLPQGSLHTGFRLELASLPVPDAEPGPASEADTPAFRQRLELELSPGSSRLELPGGAGRLELSGGAVSARLLMGSAGPQEMDGAGQVRLTGRLNLGGAALIDPAAHLDFSGNSSRTRFTARMQGLSLLAGNASLDLPGLDLRGHLDQGDLGRRLVAGLELEGLGSLDMQTRPGNSGGQHIALAGQGLQVAGLAPFLPLATTTPTEGWTLGGAADLDLDISTGTGTARLDGRLEFQGLGFVSPDGRLMADQGQGSLRAEARLSSPPTGRLDLRLENGQFLRDTLYLDLSGQPLTATIDSRALPGSPDLVAVTASAELAGLGRLAASANASAGGPRRLSLSLADIRLARLHDIFFSDPLALAPPTGPRPRATGTARLAATARFSEMGTDLEGNLRLEDAGYFRGPELSAGGLSLDLPFALTLSGDPQGVAAPGWGRLFLQNATLAGFEARDQQMLLRLGPGGLESRGGIAWAGYGGVLDLSGLSLDPPVFTSGRGGLRLALGGLDLARLSGGLPLEGFLDSDGLVLRLEDKRLSVDGQVEGSFFGGRLNARDLFAVRPFSRDRKYGGDLTIQGLDLEPLSHTLGIGRITGRLDLTAENLVMAFGQPVAFDITGTSPPEGGDRSVSLKAVNSLSVIGTGSGMSGMGVGLFASFFKEFAYDRIGFSCTLRNDLFRIEGLIREGGVEYLIRKPLFFGVNVVNSNPDNRISFSDMMERVKRVVRPDDDTGTGTGIDTGTGSPSS